MPTSYSAVSLAFANTRRNYYQRASNGSTDASFLRIAVILALFALALVATSCMVIHNYVSDFRKMDQRRRLLPHATSLQEVSPDAN